jgi:hypothetical protein
VYATACTLFVCNPMSKLLLWTWQVSQDRVHDHFVAMLHWSGKVMPVYKGCSGNSSFTSTQYFSSGWGTILQLPGSWTVWGRKNVGPDRYYYESSALGHIARGSVRSGAGTITNSHSLSAAVNQQEAQFNYLLRWFCETLHWELDGNATLVSFDDSGEYGVHF